MKERRKSIEEIERNRKMYTELDYHTNREIRNLDLAQKMAERRNHSLAASRKSSLRARMARMLSAADMTAESSRAEGRA